MLSWIVYGIGSATAGLLLALGWMTIFGHPSKVDRPMGPVLIKGLIIGIFAPFLWVEGLTRTVGPKLNDAAKRAYNSSPIRGPMRYFRVVTYTKDSARLLVFGQEADRGFKDNPVLQVQLKRDGETWNVKESQILVSDRLNKDMLVLPPYQ
ncbi:MAG: hypothetical protein ACO1SV_19345 [Fimbriimonas sp.]